MNPDLALVFLAFALIEVKHFICEFAIPQYRSELKAVYLNRTGLIHAATHGLASIPVLFLLSKSVALVIALAAVESVAHYHFDWLKASINARKHLDYSDRLYWVLFGADQLTHQLTYVAILAVLVHASSF